MLDKNWPRYDGTALYRAQIAENLPGEMSRVSCAVKIMIADGLTKQIATTSAATWLSLNIQVSPTERFKATWLVIFQYR